MAEEDVDALLARMSQMAEAVNAFKSEEVQQAALAALIAAFESGGSAKKSHRDAADLKPRSTVADESAFAGSGEGEDQAPDTASRRKRRPRTSNGAKSSIQPVRDLNLRPVDKESFDAFVEKKQPRDNQERFAVALYYLEEVAQVAPVTVAHIAAVFKQTSGWREPGNLVSGLKMTGHRKNTINTSDLNDLRTTPHGRNFVEHDLPHKSAKK